MAQPFPPERGEHAKTAILLAFSALADDPRVRRMGDCLHARGWRVIGIGLSGASSPPPAWEIYEARRSDDPHIAQVVPSQPATVEPQIAAPLPRLRHVLPKLLRPRDLTAADRQRLARIIAPILGLGRSVRRLMLRAVALAAACAIALIATGATILRRSWSARAWSLAADMASGAQGPQRVVDYVRLWRRAHSKGDAADRVFWEEPSQVLLPMRETALANGAHGLWIANDWNTLALAAECVRRHGGAYVYDSHEFATEEFAEHFYWRMFKRPIVSTLERRYIAGAKVVTTVSPGITAALKARYRLAQPCLTLRNMPRYQQVSFRATGTQPRVLYQGIVWRGRGLEEVIASVARWRSEFELTIRGPGPESYVSDLGALAAKHGVADRVRFEAPVPASELVAAATPFDIGLMALPSHSAHNAHALPNKIFEYMMAGLALCVSDLPAMRQVVRETGAGVVIARMTPEAIAEAMNALDSAHIDARKHRALEAAKRLHFEAEAAPVVSLYEDVMARTGASSSETRSPMSISASDSALSPARSS